VSGQGVMERVSYVEKAVLEESEVVV
jgi:hypothetical protein